MNELFAVFLSGAIGWATERMLSTLCPCGAESPAPVTIHNVTHNHFHCPRCGNDRLQFINATPHTVNRDKSVAVAGISHVDYTLAAHHTLKLQNMLATVNASRHPIVVEGRFGIPGRRTFYSCRTQPLTPDPANKRWHNRWNIPFSAFPIGDYTLGVDLIVYNPWKEPLDIHQRSIDSVEMFAELVRLELEILKLDLKRLALEFQRLEQEQRRFEQRYRQIVLTLAEHALHH